MLGIGRARTLGIGGALVAVLLLGGAAQAENAENAEDAEFGRDRGRHERLLERFDTDGDGELSQAERSSARESRRLRRIEKFDADGDGWLSREERRTAFESGEGRRGRHLRDARVGRAGQPPCEGGPGARHRDR